MIACTLGVSAELAGETDPNPMIKVSGEVLFGEQKAKMTHLYFSRKKTDDGPVLALLFSDHPLAERMLDDRQKLNDLAKRKAFVGLYVQLDESGSVQMTDLYHDDGSFSGSWAFEPAGGKQTITAGRIATEGEREFFGKPYSVDVTFNAGPKVDETWRGSPFYETKPTGLKLGQAEGWMDHAGKKTKLSHALAVSETDLFGDSGERKIFLTTEPPTDEMLAANMGPEQAMHKAGIVFLRVSLDAKNEIQSVMVPAEDGNPVNFSSSQWNIELAATVATEVDGRVDLTGAKDDDSEFPRFDVRFHSATRKIGAAAPVTAENGKPLAKDGGEAGKVYRDFLAALKKAKAVEDILPLRIASTAAMLNDVPLEQRAGLLEFLKQEAQVPYKIVGGFANDDQATLWLEGKQGEERIQGRVNIHREDGAWKMGMEAFRSQAE
jgi:hypothetical protein